MMIYIHFFPIEFVCLIFFSFISPLDLLCVERNKKKKEMGGRMNGTGDIGGWGNERISGRFRFMTFV